VEKGRKGGADDPKTVGNLSFEQVAKVAKMKSSGSLVRNLKQGAKEVLGTCVSLGITVDGKDARDAIKSVDAGQHDSQLV
jgi:large subunit ribosomal protein L11